jgi:hypothetical protein
MSHFIICTVHSILRMTEVRISNFGQNTFIEKVKNTSSQETSREDTV